MSRNHRTTALLLGVWLAMQPALIGDSPSPGDPDRGVEVDYDAVNNVSTMSWWGVDGENYFIQVSPDLTEDWQYVPEIFPGENTQIEHGFSSNASALFFRLRYIAQDEAFSNPENADFDEDGVGNLDELDQGTDPFLAADSDGDGIPDDWEILYGLKPNDPSDGNADPDGDGLTNAQEYILLRNPFEDEENPDARPTAPEDLVVRVHADGSRTYTWSDVSDNEDYFFIEIRHPDGNMVRVADDIPPNTTSFTVPASVIQAALQQ